MTTAPVATDHSMSVSAPDAAPVKFVRKRIEPLKAWRAVQALIADKEDTGQVFKVIDALSGRAEERMYSRFMASNEGQRIVAEKRDLIALLNDRERLKHLPEGSLGHTYYEFMAEENLTADGLVDASKEAPRRSDNHPATRIFGDRLRDSHDLWHVVSGYGRDGLGELCLLAFSYAQTKNRGIGFIVLMGARVTAKEAKGVGIWRAVREGYRHGKKARWLPIADWEALLEKPLSEVRAQFGIIPPDVYRAALPAMTALESAHAEDRKLAA